MNGLQVQSAETYSTDERRWLALQQRDPKADGQFVYAVTTTGVYCRPVCPSRLARRENVQFHQSCADAELAGFRPCQRCQPSGLALGERHAEAVAKACRMIDDAESMPFLSDLADAVGLSRYHFQRMFKRVAGVTPHQYARAQREQRVRAALRTRGSVTEAIYDAGFNSNSRFYERSGETLGMTPTEYRNGGRDIPIRYAIAPCALGLLLVAGTPRGVCAVSLGDDRAALERELRKEFPNAPVEKGDHSFKTWINAIIAHLKQPSERLDLPLDVQATAFQQRVWRALCEIPSGQTATYAQLAARIKRPSAVRAVARAIATNPVALLIPCHRVIRTGGALGGYRWGVERKRKLLRNEARVR